jgi:hypothetical protein
MGYARFDYANGYRMRFFQLLFLDSSAPSLFSRVVAVQ